MTNVFENYPTFSLGTEYDLVPQCRFLNVDDLPVHVPNDKLSILVFNIRSCRKNFNDFICNFSDYFNRFTIIILLETWLTEGISRLFPIYGFKHFDLFRANDGGGIRVYVKNFINTKVLPTYTMVSDLYELLTLEMIVSGNKVLLCGFYHPPSSDHRVNYEFIDQCCANLNMLLATGLPVIVCGDFNLNLLNPLKLRYITDFVENMYELSLFPVITIPTKYNPENLITKYSLIDQIWTNIPNKVTTSGVIPVEITDHFPVMASFQLVVEQNIHIQKRRIFNNGNNAIFSGEISSVYPVVNGDVNLTFDAYYMNVFGLYDRAFPIIEIVIKDDINCPWITPNIRACIKKKAKLYRMVVRGTINKADYTYFSNHLTTLLRRAKRLYYYKLFLRVGIDSSKLWMHINNILGNRTKTSMVSLKVNDVALVGTDMVNYANSYFVNIAGNITNGLVRPVAFAPLQEPNLFSFIFLHTNEHEVAMVICSLKNKGSVLTDLSVVCLKKNIQVFSQHITLLYNFSIECETFPDRLKVAGVTPAHKSGSRDSIDNYRPISNLPVLSKVFEKLTLIRLMSFVSRYELLSDSQYGFRRGRNTSQAAIRLVTLIMQAFSKKMYCACFFLDLRKAFDTVDHPILMLKLSNAGFRGPIFNYLLSYLTNRKQFVQVRDFKSSELLINKGVPQGSLLGPLLFSLYINDIVLAVDAETVLFADDAAFFLSAPSLSQLYARINLLFMNLSRYLKVNKLVPNLNKSKLMLFSRNQSSLPDISFDSEKIEWVKEYKYLGLILTSSMSFGPHIDKVCTQVSQYIGIFYHLSKSIPRKILALLYNSFILPHLSLHIEIWGAAPNWHLNRLVVKQNKLLRALLGVVILNGIPTIPTVNMYNTLNILTIPNLYKLLLFKFFLQMKRGYLPYFFENILRPLQNAHSYNTRSGDYRHPMIYSEAERRSIAHQVVLLYESIPVEEYDGCSLAGAVSKFKKYLLAHQL